VGPRAVLDATVKRKIPSPRRELNPITAIFQSVAQRCEWGGKAKHLKELSQHSSKFSGESHEKSQSEISMPLPKSDSLISLPLLSLVSYLFIVFHGVIKTSGTRWVRLAVLGDKI
jgi:hypothetical protein